MYEIEEQSKGFKRTSSIFGFLGSFIFESIEAIVVALAVCVVLYLFLITPHEVFGRSMFPNFQDGEYLIANKIVYKFKEPERGDVIIFKHSPTQDYIKRIVAIPGDTVSVMDGKIYLNGEKLDESGYLDESVYTSGGAALQEGETITILPDEYFVVGDNRPQSSDSRAFGPIEKGVIKGKAWLVYFPFNRFRTVEHQDYAQ